MGSDDAIQVADGIAVAGEIPVFAGPSSGFRRQPLAKQRPDGVERGPSSATR
jgi:hypothetical protein